MASGGHPEGAALVTRHDQLAGSLARLQRLAASRQAALMESVCRCSRRKDLASSGYAPAMSWEQEQARLAALLEEIISDNEDNDAVESDASLDEDFIQESDHDSLSK
ncbi:unnamed protein product [Danaus chrysippus]|uniref:(African queen) hypothetical protein n=1 Tax=Danaus chrysippus TaxID=151541 RepID=A0A8J2R1E2_9NEOP|nr:unnamed protein product [Danaus chrysippus]